VWSHHVHGITDGDGGVSRSAAAQQKAYHARRNALANNGPDRGYQMLVFPLFVFPEKAVGKPGKCWAAVPSRTFEQPTSESEQNGSLSVGAEFDVVAVLNVNGAYWGIDKAARCTPMKRLSRTKIAA
jgi:hypothetical protein